MACALIHSPPLLILDEPTVGTDPILRKTILSHLSLLCESGVTIILTTHYIEEARNANVVAFMRNGTILAEGSPDNFLEKYYTSSLEVVFLKLCESEKMVSHNNNNEENDFDIKIQKHCYENEVINERFENKSHVSRGGKNSSELRIESINNNVNIDIKFTENGVQNKTQNNNDFQLNHLKKISFVGKTSALMLKNFKRMTRSWIQLIMFILVPATLLVITLYSLGDKTTNINLAIFNEEINSNVSNGLGELFVKSIDNKTFNIIQFNSYEKAFDSVKMGQTFAVVDINDRFSKALRLRAIYGSDADEETLEESQIRVQIDWSNQMIGVLTKRYLYEAIIKFVEEVARSSGVNSETVKIPLSFDDPVYGTDTESLRDYALPGFYILLAYFCTCALACNALMEERKDGILERSLVSGITALDFILTQALTQFIIICFQVVFLISIPSLLFDRQLNGSLVLIIALLLSQGLGGITFGLMSAICSDSVFSVIFCFVAFLISIVIGGVFWPIENMPALLQYVGPLMPTTLPIKSLRNILYREWTIGYPEVYMGFISTYLWLSFFVIIAYIFLRKSL